MCETKSIGILGSGTWGVALARLLERNGHRLTVWSKFFWRKCSVIRRLR